MEKIRLIGRASGLSKLQMEKLRDQIALKFPALQIELLTKSSRGDALADIPLQTVEGTDFFTSEIFNALASGEADLAVHSLKDMSSDHFFGSNRFAVPDREDPRDVLFFRGSFREKLEAGLPVIVGTCSPRREQMATRFLVSIFEKGFSNPQIELKTIRGNVDTRLRKLADGHYDAIILAAAGVNRLLSTDKTADLINKSLAQLEKLFLPLIECAPAPCQGAIVAEALPENVAAVEVLETINNESLYSACVAEKKLALQFGKGCDQRFGILSRTVGDKRFLYAGGEDAKGGAVDKWYDLPRPEMDDLRIFNSADFMGKFFSYEYLDVENLPNHPVVFVANHKAVHSEKLVTWLKSRRVWVAGTRTWKELMKKGIWVEGSADALGLESLTDFWQTPLANIDRDDLILLTHAQASPGWKKKGFATLATYRLIPEEHAHIESAVAAANFLFWTSTAQYLLYKHAVNSNAVHACPAGETAVLLREEGLNPVLFPTIKSFQQWRTDYTR